VARVRHGVLVTIGGEHRERWRRVERAGVAQQHGQRGGRFATLAAQHVHAQRIARHCARDTSDSTTDMPEHEQGLRLLDHWPLSDMERAVVLMRDTAQYRF